MNCWLLKRGNVYYIKYAEHFGIARKSLRTGDRRSAQAIHAKENADLALSEYGIKGKVAHRITYAALVQQYLGHKRTKGRKSNTIVALVHAFNNFGAVLGTDQYVHKISEEDVERFERSRRDAGRAAKTIRNELSALRSLFAFAVARRYTLANPLENYELPKKERRRP